MKIRWIVLMMAIVLSSSLMAQQHEQCGKAMKPAHECRIEGLTPDQQSAIKKVRNEVKQQNLQLKADLEIKKAELDKLLLADKPVEKEVDKKIEEIGALKMQIMKNKTHGEMRIRELLTPEQRLQFDSKKDLKKHCDKKDKGDMPKQGQPCKHGDSK